MKRKCIFLDRDGVLNRDEGYTHKWQDHLLYEDVVPTLLRLQELGFLLVVVSNQSGVSRGFYDVDDVMNFNRSLCSRLSRSGVRMDIDRFFFCPHHPEENCSCRKPGTGLIEKAVRQHSISLELSYMIGDRESDVLAGRNAGMTTILLNRTQAVIPETGADHVIHSLEEVLNIIDGGISGESTKTF